MYVFIYMYMEEIPPMFRENHTKPYDFSFVHNLDLIYLCNIKTNQE